MSRRLTSDLVLTAALVAAAVISFSSSYVGWSGRTDAWFVLSVTFGVVFAVMATRSAVQSMRRYYAEQGLRVPLITVTKDSFSREPPIRGKGRI